MGDGDKHSCSQDADVMFVGILRNQCAPFARKLRFECAGSLVKPGMDHAAIETRGFLAGPAVFLNAGYRQTLPGEFSRNCAPDNASAAYDADVKHRSGKSLKIASTPSIRNIEASAGSFMVHTLISRLASRAASISAADTMS